MATLIEHINALANRIASEIKSLKSDKLSNNGTGGTLKLTSWFRSLGNTGWYSEAWGGGIHMIDPDWIRTFGGKKLHIDNTSGDAFYVLGGVRSDHSVGVNADRWGAVNAGDYNGTRYNTAPIDVQYGECPVGTFRPIISGTARTQLHGFITKIKLGHLIANGPGWAKANLFVGSAESNDHPMYNYTFDAYGLVELGAVRTTLPQLNEDSALTRKDYVDAADYASRWGNAPVISHNLGDANAHYNSAWDGSNVANAPSPSWYFFRELHHSNMSGWRHQEAFDFFNEEEYFRRTHGGTEMPWMRRWHSGNLTVLNGTFTPLLSVLFTHQMPSDGNGGFWFRMQNSVTMSGKVNITDTNDYDQALRIDGLPFVPNHQYHFNVAIMFMGVKLNVRSVYGAGSATYNYIDLMCIDLDGNTRALKASDIVNENNGYFEFGATYYCQ